MMQVTPVFAAIFAFFFVGLSVRTLLLRRRFGVAIGDGDQPALARASRAHANFAEYVPMALLLLYFAEQAARSSLLVASLGVLLLLGRSFHAWGLSQVSENYVFRVSGMALTFTAILSSALLILVAYAGMPVRG